MRPASCIHQPPNSELTAELALPEVPVPAVELPLPAPAVLLAPESLTDAAEIVPDEPVAP